LLSPGGARAVQREGEVVKESERDCISRPHMTTLLFLLLFGRDLLDKRYSLVRVVQDTKGVLFHSAISGGAFLYFQTSSATSAVLGTEWSTRTDLVLVFALLTYFLCDSACSAAVGIFTERLITPFWHRVRKRRPALATSSSGGSRSLRHRLCSPLHNERCSRPCRSMQVSHNRAPPQVPAHST
jgi:hypothetical protein